MIQGIQIFQKFLFWGSKYFNQFEINYPGYKYFNIFVLGGTKNRGPVFL